MFFSCAMFEHLSCYACRPRQSVHAATPGYHITSKYFWQPLLPSQQSRSLFCFGFQAAELPSRSAHVSRMVAQSSHKKLYYLCGVSFLFLLEFSTPLTGANSSDSYVLAARVCLLVAQCFHIFSCCCNPCYSHWETSSPNTVCFDMGLCFDTGWLGI